MKIGNPIDELPQKGIHRAAYAEIYDLAIINAGAWVPVEFDSNKKMKAFVNAARSRRRGSAVFRDVSVVSRGLTAFIRLPKVTQ